MSLEKKSSNNFSKGVVFIKSLLDIPREILNLDCDSNDTLGEGKFDQVTLASYRGLHVAVKQFHAAVSQAEIEHEANIISSFKHLNLLVFFGISCPEKLICLSYNSIEREAKHSLKKTAFSLPFGTA